MIAAEDTRVTSKLLAIHGVSKPLIPYNDHNAPEMRPKILARLERGEAVVLVSDAGTPLVSDPGYKLVRAVVAAGAAVVAIPGPSAVLAGLTLSGLPSDRFLFAGFLPSRQGERKTALEELKTVRATLIFLNPPSGCPRVLAAMADVLGDRACAVTRELTKMHEEVRRGSLDELAAHLCREAGPPKGEVTLAGGPAGRGGDRRCQDRCRTDGGAGLHAGEGRGQHDRRSHRWVAQTNLHPRAGIERCRVAASLRNGMATAARRLRPCGCG